MPWLLETLMRNLDFDLEQVADVIDPILTAQNYCQASGCYVQGVVVGDRGFITTNLSPVGVIRATTCGTRWLIGYGVHCGIAVVGEGVAQYHAALDFDPPHGFSLTDLGGETGTWLNGRRLGSNYPHPLQEGDVVQMGSLRFEFLQELCSGYTGYSA
jgi:hypothetical protein